MLASLLDLVLPRPCAGCSASGPGLCGPCRVVLAAPPRGRVAPEPSPPGLPEVCAFAVYDGTVQRLLIAHKERGRLDLTAPLAAALASAVAPLGPGPLVLCPVPSSRAAVRQRGHDHAWRLATAAAGALKRAGLTVVARRLLLPARRTADQAGLTTAQRAANLRGALVAVPAPSPAPVVVVDDVMTTGATLVEAARALAAAGHTLRGAAVVAATSRRRAGASSPQPLHPGPERR